MALETYPHASRVPAFYGQSASLTAFLAQRAQPSQFIEFLRQSESLGYDLALQQVYAIEGVAHLERLWGSARAGK